MNKDHTTLEIVLDGLMRRYKERVPDVQAIIIAMRNEGIISSDDEIENDHIAFRTLGLPYLGIASFEKIFLHLGYQKMESYHFPEKKLDAYWYAPPEEKYPRIFVSELRVGDLTEEAQQIIQKYAGGFQSDPVDGIELNDGGAVDHFLHSPLWPVPQLEEYQRLAEESEYAAWVIYNRYYLNHFTISVHNLKEGYNTIEAFNEFLLRHQFLLNNSGGVIKTSPDNGLLQSSTVAKSIEAEFAGGEKAMIPGSYVEFAERRVLAEFAHLPAEEIKRKHRREGFEAGNADKIFESTYRSQPGRV
jgi:hypothetical protein